MKDLPRPGATRRITAMIEAKVLSVVQLPPPAGKTHWSNVEIGKKVKIHPRRVAEILNRNHWAIYESPEKSVVICVDEKTVIQALDRHQPNLPMKAHQIARRKEKWCHFSLCRF